MGEPPSPAEESVHSLPQQEEDLLADNCGNSTVAAPASSGTQIPQGEPGTTDDLQVPVADAVPPVPKNETPEIAPPTTPDCSTAIQNDASPAHPGRDSGVAESQDETTKCLANHQRDSGLASIDIELSQQSEPTATPQYQPYRPETVVTEFRETEVAEVAVLDDMPETVGSMQTFKPVSAPVSYDARSITARSIGGRSLVAPSTISPEDEVLSLRVRSLYDSGIGGMGSDVSSQFSSDAAQRRISRIMEESANAGVSRIRGTRSSFPGASRDVARRSRIIGGSVEDLRLGGAPAEDEEEIAIPSKRSSMAGGIEDWEDLEGHDIDRYGFINATYINSTAQTPENAKGTPKRVATTLFRASQEPRKRPALKTLRLSPSAPEMLKSPLPEMTIIMRDKENTRSRKWKEMAVRNTRVAPGTGTGMEWSFDTTNSKLISRTWKGIPDCWRGAAWHAFLSASAEARQIGKPDAELAAIYNELVEKPSSDDVQIDLDVPRTISSHIMFRRRYRGGQRLLFRVLHSLALYFPEVGYVQGMASIAATLLCYYDEETAFVMMVRLWELRGLEQLYMPGFGGLMEALDEFETGWMKGNHANISKKLTELGVVPTAYSTRWYLTLFNYSIPFAAQLRVWDVFMLLGDPEPGAKTTFGGTLDVLHATSAAILDGLRSIILKSDFEDAMKNLTSFIPVKDEDLLMKVVKAEWKQRRRKFAGHHF